MMSNEGYHDRVLVCRDCQQEFTFTTGEQEFFASKGLTNTPTRCPSCRAARRGGASNTTARSPRAPRGASYETICANCGRPTTVPFIPSEGRAVYCSDCFQAQRAANSSRRDEGRSSYSESSSYGGNSGYESDTTNGGGYREGRGRDRGDRRDNGRNRRDYDRWDDNW